MEKRKCNFGMVYQLKNIIILIPVAISSWIIWTTSEKKNFLFWGGVCIFVLGCILGFILQERRIKKFRCPKCKTIIKEPTIKERKTNDPINYYCHQ